MVGEELIINFDRDDASLVRNKYLPFRQLGFPEIARKCRSEVHLVVKVVEFTISRKRLIVDILHYNQDLAEFSDKQKALEYELKTIEEIRFTNLDPFWLQRMFAVPIKYNYLKVNVAESFESYVETKTESQPEFKNSREHNISKSFKINEKIFFPLKKVHFKNGGVLLEMNIKEYNKYVELTIPNAEIKEEFDAIKNYIGNVLKTKKIEVVINVEVVNDEIVFKEAYSPQIESIDAKTIENVRLDLIQNTIKRKLKEDADRDVVTLKEILSFDHQKEKVLEKFYQNEHDFIEDILRITKSKHYLHSRYLSSKHLHNVMKLRFVMRPFSFIFLVEGEHHYYFVWETLYTKEATYIWQTEKDKQKAQGMLNRIENTIKEIRVNGKLNYLSLKEEDQSRVFHYYTDDINGFRKWKDEIDEIIK